MNVNFSAQEMPFDLQNPKEFKESSIDFGEGGIKEDLDGMMVDASLNNLTWLSDGISLIPNSKDNDTKDDLEFQWNKNDGDIGEFNYQDSPEAKKMPTPCDTTLDIVQKTREFLNQGMSKDEIFLIIGKKFSAKAARDAKKAWIKNGTDKIAGIVGRIAVDLRGYNNPRVALKHASLSPYKKFIKYVIGETGDTELRVKNASCILGDDSLSSGNSTDDFFGAPIKAAKKQLFSKDLMMPILAHSFDLDDSEAADTLVQLSSMGYMAESELETIKKEAKTAYGKIKKAFLLIDFKKNAKLANSYKEKVSNEAFIIKKADNHIGLAKKPKAGVDISDVTLPKSEEVSFSKDDLGKVEIKGKEMDISLEKNKKATLDIKPEHSQMDVKIDKNKKASIADIEPECFQEEEFKGIDAFDFNEEKKPEGALEIDGRSDFSF